MIKIRKKSYKEIEKDIEILNVKLNKSEHLNLRKQSIINFNHQAMLEMSEKNSELVEENRKLIEENENLKKCNGGFTYVRDLEMVNENLELENGNLRLELREEKNKNYCANDTMNGLKLEIEMNKHPLAILNNLSSENLKIKKVNKRLNNKISIQKDTINLLKEENKHLVQDGLDLQYHIENLEKEKITSFNIKLDNNDIVKLIDNKHLNFENQGIIFDIYSSGEYISYLSDIDKEYEKLEDEVFKLKLKYNDLSHNYNSIKNQVFNIDCNQLYGLFVDGWLDTIISNEYGTRNLKIVASPSTISTVLANIENKLNEFDLDVRITNDDLESLITHEKIVKHYINGVVNITFIGDYVNEYKNKYLKLKDLLERTVILD